MGVVAMMRLMREVTAVPDSIRRAVCGNMACVFLHRGCRLRWWYGAPIASDFRADGERAARWLLREWRLENLSVEIGSRLILTGLVDPWPEIFYLRHVIEEGPHSLKPIHLLTGPIINKNLRIYCNPEV